MAISTAPSATGERSPLLIPERTKLHGPVTASRLRRLAAVFAVLWSAGLAPLVLDAGPRWKAFGLGLLVPGGGFVYTSDVVFVAASLLAFLFAFVAWFGSGNILAPPIAWVGAAALATLRTHTGLWTWAEVAVPVAVGAGVAGGVIGQRVAFGAARRRGAQRNEYLARHTFESPPRLSTPPLEPELGAEDLAHARHLFDLALQPIDSFEGFTWVDQFQTSAVRYQLNFAQYALASLQYTRTPAFTGYLSEAQRNLITKVQDKRVWKYWRLENLWGNLGLDPDPIPRDNIMLSGYLGVMLGTYETTNVDGRYDAPGSIVFRWNDRKQFAYDHHTIAAAVQHNFRASSFGMFPCEPNWIYSACNTYGINTLLAHDRLHGTNQAAEVIAGFTHACDVEFLTADGRVTAIRSSRLGLTIPMLTSTMADAGTVLFLNPSMPAVAQRSWLLVRTELLSLDGDGRVRMQLRGWDKLDVGNYKLGTDVSAHGIVAAAAREMGDDEMYTALCAAVEEKFEPVTTNGARRYAKASTLANCMLALSRFGRPNGFRDLVAHGEPDAWRAGPTLAEAAYPDVLVARAVTDGAALDLVLYPGDGARRVALKLERLVPGRTYAVTGGSEAEVTATVDGRATLHVDLGGRQVVRVVPSA